MYIMGKDRLDSNQQLEGMYLSNTRYEREVIKDVGLIGTWVEDSVFDSCNIQDLNGQSNIFGKNCEFTGCSLDRWKMTGEFRHSVFEHTGIITSRFVDTQFRQVDFDTNLAIHSVVFKDCLFEECVFSDVEFMSCTFKNCCFRRCVFMGETNGRMNTQNSFIQCRIEEVLFEGCHFLPRVDVKTKGIEKNKKARRSTIFSGCNDRNIKFMGCRIEGLSTRSLRAPAYLDNTGHVNGTTRILLSQYSVIYDPESEEEAQKISADESSQTEVEVDAAVDNKENDQDEQDGNVVDHMFPYRPSPMDKLFGAYDMDAYDDYYGYDCHSMAELLTDEEDKKYEKVDYAYRFFTEGI